MSDDSVAKHGSRFKNLVGMRFNRLEVISYAGRKARNSLWLCRCECGNTKIATAGKLKQGLIQSCGCLQREHWDKIRTHGMRNAPEYNVWQVMVQRCTNPRHSGWHKYGGRGITICKRWKTFANFFADMGERPGPEYQIDRRDNESGYCPKNCHWVTKTQNARNKRNTVFVIFNGKKMPVTEFAELSGMSPVALRARVRNGWSMEDIVTLRWHQWRKR